MATDADLRARFWDGLRDDKTVMLGLSGDWPEPPRPMTALTEDDQDHGPIWFFTSTDTQLAAMLAEASSAILTFTAKGHDLFATVQGRLTVDHDPAVIDRLWSPFIAAWYEGGRDDPRLLLLRFDPIEAEIWKSSTGFVAGLKMLLGQDPREDAEQNITRGPID